MSLIVQKFGGTSVANAERLFNVANIVTQTYKQGNDVVVVVSAQGDTTDDLIAKAILSFFMLFMSPYRDFFHLFCVVIMILQQNHNSVNTFLEKVIGILIISASGRDPCAGQTKSTQKSAALRKGAPRKGDLLWYILPGVPYFSS